MIGRVLAFSALALTVQVPVWRNLAGAQTVGGGGTKAADCWVTFWSTPAPNFPASRTKHVKCADQDTMCGDANTRLGYCSYQLQLTLNDSYYGPGCAPTDLTTFNFLIPYSGATNDEHPKHNEEFEPFQTFVQDNLPTAAMTDVTKVGSVTVPMPVSFSPKGPTFKSTTVQMHPTMCSVPLINGKCPPGALKDLNTFNLTCTPAVDSMTGAKISPCTGISSTFQQIQEHIFDRKCSNLAACHGSMMQGNLCLKDPSQPCDGATRTTYTDLVGKDPTNAVAALDLLKRVDADGVTSGDPANSLLVHKIKGGVQLSNKAGVRNQYGIQMPYSNPTLGTGRIRPKLSRGEIQLISDWIQAGAPGTGFVTTTAAGACH